ncbi:MAG: hypothetical protein KF868_06395 [Acidobacteria bacterium]|nr:hypothetical protein [Acidobacteriota bacterium]
MKINTDFGDPRMANRYQHLSIAFLADCREPFGHGFRRCRLDFAFP